MKYDTDSSCSLLQDLSMLSRAKVSLMVGVAAAFGYFLATPSVDVKLLAVAGGCFFLTAACSAWNQVQERNVDALMPRTAPRPLPSGRMQPGTAIVAGLVFFCVSLLLFYSTGAYALLTLALGIIALYNGVYTPLKQYSGFALLIGAVAGAAPLVFGWVAAGGHGSHPLLGLFYGVCLFWQIPHFWLRVQKYREEYIKARIPVSPIIYSQSQYVLLLALWLMSFALSVLMLAVFPLLHNETMRVCIAALALICLLMTAVLLYHSRSVYKKRLPDCSYGSASAFLHTRTSKFAFCIVDSTMLLVCGIMLTDKLLQSAL